MSRDEATLADILLAARRIARFTEGIDQARFLADVEKQSAVLHQLLVLGEAVRRLSRQTRAAHPTIPWQKIASMRNMLIHEYDRVDLNIVWYTVEQEVPALLAYVAGFVPADR